MGDSDTMTSPGFTFPFQSGRYCVPAGFLQGCVQRELRDSPGPITGIKDRAWQLLYRYCALTGSSRHAPKPAGLEQSSCTTMRALHGTATRKEPHNSRSKKGPAKEWKEDSLTGLARGSQVWVSVGTKQWASGALNSISGSKCIVLLAPACRGAPTEVCPSAANHDPTELHLHGGTRQFRPLMASCSQ